MRVFLTLCATALTLWVSAQKANDTDAIHHLLNTWHENAAKGNGDAYIAAMTDDGVFIGTDATEYWTREAFWKFAEPYFKKGAAWDFKPLKRHVYLSADGKIAWFDEVLDTWMELCRGSGVLIRQADGSWKIAHYVLSVTVPNDVVDDVIKVKHNIETKQKDVIKSQ
ncbi:MULTISPECIES: nuclear transport factor 2 family protein [unclassified Flavobacterium]|uniref:nuclear transport factor 2 family protein n=1 Tax=unclassified Flavobacterium TaxID=196869 RepID=UPI001F1474AF|nr:MULTISPECIES: nuclear transport factor 2 family protein [unclassified Flavobacterium]UMY66159.1 nuclear transport factor 2 family protein [Flavobacterium sp. HJ-32-4]